MQMSRRSFLEKCGLGALAAGLTPVGPRNAEAAWGELPTGFWPTSYQPKKILEIFCFGGMSQWENFWVSEDVAGRKNWREFQAQVQGLHWRCPPGSAPADQARRFATAADGTPVFWGPATKPLWRSDIVSRSRMVVVAHTLQPHEVAIPLNLTGLLLGNPRLAGKGAAIQHRAVAADGPRPVPYSFVLVPEGLPPEHGPLAAAANGMHPGFAKPMVIKIGNPSFVGLLGRGHMTAQAEQLMRSYQAAYRDHLRFHGMGDAVRSAGFLSYETAVEYLLHAADLSTLLGGGVLNVGLESRCGIKDPAAPPPPQPNLTRTALEAATRLLNVGRARYVGIVDIGFPGTFGGYDTHTVDDQIEVTSSSVFNLCTHLAAQIAPNRLNLDDVMIVINTEFGRTPTVGEMGGRDHWPHGYAVILIGGPILRPVRLGMAAEGTIAGGLDAHGNPSGSPFSPADMQGAVLLAAGIDPFAPENFGVSDFTSEISGGGTHSAVQSLMNKVLGVP